MKKPSIFKTLAVRSFDIIINRQREEPSMMNAIREVAKDFLVAIIITAAVLPFVALFEVIKLLLRLWHG